MSAPHPGLGDYMKKIPVSHALWVQLSTVCNKCNLEKISFLESFLLWVDLHFSPFPQENKLLICLFYEQKFILKKWRLQWADFFSNHCFICSINAICQRCPSGRLWQYTGWEGCVGKPFCTCSDKPVCKVQGRMVETALGWFSKSHSKFLLS